MKQAETPGQGKVDDSYEKVEEDEDEKEVTKEQQLERLSEMKALSKE